MATEADATAKVLLDKKCNNTIVVGGGVSFAVQPKAIYQGPKRNCSE
jgi:hypothetical protein